MEYYLFVLKHIINGIKRIVLPKANSKEASMVKGMEVIGLENLKQVIQYLNGEIHVEPEEVNIEEVLKVSPKSILDFSDVKGQEFAKRALEISAAGGHNCLLVGPQGSGKTMLSKRMSSILPNLTFEEALEITKIYSVSGILKDEAIVSERPFRSPHYTISRTALIGGGKMPKPRRNKFSTLRNIISR